LLIVLAIAEHLHDSATDTLEEGLGSLFSEKLPQSAVDKVVGIEGMLWQTLCPCEALERQDVGED
jgi:hypothetical protein